jgi:hypothetical protein
MDARAAAMIGDRPLVDRQEANAELASGGDLGVSPSLAIDARKERRRIGRQRAHRCGGHPARRTLGIEICQYDYRSRMPPERLPEEVTIARVVAIALAHGVGSAIVRIAPPTVIAMEPAYATRS